MKTLVVFILTILFAFSCEFPNPTSLRRHPHESRISRHHRNRNSGKQKTVLPNGIRSLKEWVANSTNYPQEAVDRGIEGKVVVRFAVNAQGNVIKAKIVQAVHPLLDREALRVIRSLPRWKQSNSSGQIMYYNIPITFKLQ